MTGIDRRYPPLGRKPELFTFPPFERFSLGPGLDLWAAVRPRIPLVELELITPGGASRQTLPQSGLASLTGAMLDEGTKDRSGPEIALELERLGGALSSGAGWHVAYIALQLLSKHCDRGLNLISELVREPTFPPEEIERLRGLRLAELLRRRDHPGSLASDAVARLLWDGGPWQDPLLGSAASLATLGREALDSFWRSAGRSAPAHLLAVGDFDLDALREAAQPLAESFSTLGPEAAPGTTFLAHQPQGVEVHVVDRPGAAQTELRIAHQGPPRQHADRAATQVMNTLLGGKFTSRINLNLRERNGFTYGASSRFEMRREGGAFRVATAVATEHTGSAAREILLEMRRLQQEPVPEEEVEDTKSYLLGVLPYTVQSCSDVQQRLAELAIFDLPSDEHDLHQRRVAATTHRDVEEAARRHLQPDRCLIVAVGPAEELREPLSALGRVRVWAPGELFDSRE